MATSWSTRLDGDPVACGQLAARLQQMAADVSGVARAVSRERQTAGWVGNASGSAHLRVSACATATERCADRLQALSAAVWALGDALAGVESQLGRARACARADGLTVTTDGFHAPEGHQAAAQVQAARAEEAAAHATLVGALVALTQGSFVRRTTLDLVNGLLLLPPESDAWDKAAWGVGIPGAVASIPTDRFKASLSLVAAGAVHSEDVHVARTARVAEAMAPAGKGALRGLGFVGNGATVVLDSRDQWRADADDPSLTGAERIGRTAVRGAIEGGATILGAGAGAALLSPIPGGSFVGGVVGGKVGELVGGWAADNAVEYVDDVIEFASDAKDLAEDAAEAASDAADAVADMAGEVTDKLCFWD